MDSDPPHTLTPELAQERSISETESGVWALVPVKSPENAKRRLRPCLGASCTGFALAMLEDVLNATADSRKIAGTAVVTRDKGVAELAASRGLLVIDDSGSTGMNAAIALGLARLRRHGAQRVLVIPSDIPLATGEEFDRLVTLIEADRDDGGNDGIALTASADGGTNLLYLDPNRVMETRFGPDSYRLHGEAAARQSLRILSLDSPMVAIDIDQQHDLDAMIAHCQSKPRLQNTKSWRFLADNGLISQLSRTA